MNKIFLNEFTGKEIREAIEGGSITCAIAVFGSCENHGDHLPLGPDLFVPMEMARRVAERVDGVVIAPGFPVGASIHYNAYPLTLNLRYETMIAVAEDVLDSLVASGIDRILMLNGHDGNIPALEIAARNVKNRHRDSTIVYVPSWWDITAAKIPEALGDWSGLGHGGEGETSVTMAVRPDLVHLADAVRQMPDDVIRLGEFSTIIWDIEELTATGATGDPTGASADKGERMIGVVVDHLVELIESLRDSGWEYDRRGR